MLTKLGKHKFKFVRPNGTAIWYDVKTLVEYLVKTGEFREPETRLEFSSDDLERMDQLARAAGLRLPSVVAAKGNTKPYDEKRAAEDALLCLERFCGEVVADIHRCLEIHDPETVEMCLVGQLFPSFSHFFQQIQERAGELARQLIKKGVNKTDIGLKSICKAGIFRQDSPSRNMRHTVQLKCP